LRGQIRNLAAARVRYGYDQLYILLQLEGWRMNHKRVYRLDREEGLSMRALTLVDNLAGESLDIEVGHGLRGEPSGLKVHYDNND
jgi:hypothetical protein